LGLPDNSDFLIVSTSVTTDSKKAGVPDVSFFAALNFPFSLYLTFFAPALAGCCVNPELCAFSGKLFVTIRIPVRGS